MNLNRMLKGALALTIALFSGLTVHAQRTFTIKGQMAKDKQGQIILTYPDGDKRKADTLKVVNGSFLFKGEVSRPCYATLDLNRPEMSSRPAASQFDRQDFYLEATAITVTGDDKIKAALIKGGKSQIEFAELMMQYKPLQEENAGLNEKMAAYRQDMNEAGIKEVQEAARIVTLKRAKIDSTLIKNHPDSFVAFDLWAKKMRSTIDPVIEPAFLHFTPAIRNSREGKIIGEKIAKAKMLDVGRQAPDFTLKDTLGHPVSLSSLRGKNVMLCFWYNGFSSYETFAFNLQRINRRLHDKNLVILGVYYNSVNKGSDKTEYWKELLQRSGMNWLNVEDIGGIDYRTGSVKSATATAYALGPESLPIAYLIGPDGKILARHLALADNNLSKTIGDLLK
ncbi:peroxiredoxin [Mucilaginibacter gracilis]|uniref:Peroxiredoxin n=1 Tax=Mucilaginibacter gracilis TaxID=423350 RepID=A0A495J4L9_9SPHI|nr:DUF4369 domain-containing protein [Mucilaginibacter gracilis]RKR82929.1 peroxiredoxin [Mucilaginibacter gracilis]